MSANYELIRGGGDLYLIYDDVAPILNHYVCHTED